MDQNKSTQATGNGKKTEEINELLESFIKEGPKLLWGSTNLKYEDQISRSSEHELQQYRVREFLKKHEFIFYNFLKMSVKKKLY